MAPDLNGLSSKSRETWDYTTPGATGYNISNHVYNDPATRKLKVLTVGAGLSSIMMAYQIEKECQNVENVIYEKNSDIGGTWLENRYPGCACDVPSHAYTFAWALNPDWPQFFSRSPDIWEYLNKICEVFNLRRYMTFNTEVIAMDWQEDLGQWKVTLKQQQPGQEPRIFEEHCDLLLYATGLLNHFKWPNIPGLEKFKGRKVHTAKWPADYDDSKWKNDRVAIIGSGASSVQTLPNMQPFAKHIDVFVRTGVWFVQIANNYGQNHEYTVEEKEKFRTEPDALVAHAKSIENQINFGWDMFFSDSEAQRMARDMFKQRMREFIKDDRLLEGFTPKFEVGCRRITPGDPYMKAIQEPNVDVHFTTVTSITETGVVGQDGIEREVDTIVCATGFDVTYRPRFPVRGRNGVDLAEKWRDAPEGYLGLAVPDMPNFLMFIGPTWPVENGSVTGPLQQVGKYTIDFIKKMQRDHIKSMCPRQDITDSFNAHAQEWYTHTVWRDSCRAWYKNNDTNRINAIWPGSSLHYIEVLRNPRWEDYDIRYMHFNPFAALGMGNSLLDSDPNKQDKDLSPYLQRENIDPRWLKAVGYPGKL